MKWQTDVKQLFGKTDAGVSADYVVDGRAALLLQVVSKMSPVIRVFGALDGSVWYPIAAISLDDREMANTINASGLYAVSCSGLERVRLTIHSGDVESVVGAGTTAPFGYVQCCEVEWFPQV